MPQTNPLLADSELPQFEDFKTEHVIPAMEKLVPEAKNLIDKLCASVAEPGWDNIVVPIDEQDRKLENAWALFGHLNSVRDSAELRQAYQKALAMATEYQTWVGQHQGLFKAYKAISERKDFSRLSRARQESVKKALLAFKLNGIDLPKDKRKKFARLKSELAQLQQKFSEQLLDATQAWTLHITDEKRLAGLPETARETLSQYASQKNLDGWLVTLEMPSTVPLLTYADDRSLREEVSRACQTRASDKGPNAGQFDNGPLMTDILEKRQKIAELLGYSNYAQVSLEQKMATSPQAVLAFLNDMAEKVLPQAKREFEELREFAKSELGLEVLEPWDINYASEKLRQARFSISREELRPYFPVNRAVEGLFKTAEKLFSLGFEEVTEFQTYHPDVKLFNVLESGKMIARFYLDLYARAGKRGGAWMDVCRNRMERGNGGTIQLPVAYLTCNFTPPVGDKPSLLTTSELSTLFHEFGHGLQHMLTKIGVKSVAGISGVEWDAVELPSQFLENWCREEEALAFISSHVDSGKALPSELLEKMLAAKNFQSAMTFVRQLEFGIFDFTLHGRSSGFSQADIQNAIDQVRSKVSVVPKYRDNRFQHGFSHIFAGGYAAGYYSYKWAEVLSADAYSRFEEEGVFSPEAAADFRNTVLALGGSKPAAEVFRQYRGRDPRPEALLRHNGITV